MCIELPAPTLQKELLVFSAPQEVLDLFEAFSADDLSSSDLASFASTGPEAERRLPQRWRNAGVKTLKGQDLVVRTRFNTNFLLGIGTGEWPGKYQKSGLNLI